MLLKMNEVEHNMITRKQSILNSLNNLINSNKNTFETQKFGLVKNLTSIVNSTSTVPNTQTNPAVATSNLILPCWLVEDCLVDLSKENYSEYDNYLIIQKIVSLIKEYVFNLIEYENRIDSFKRLNLVNETITEEEDSSTINNNSSDDNKNFANSFLTSLVEEVKNDLNNKQMHQAFSANLSDTLIESSLNEYIQYNSFASNIITDLFTSNNPKSDSEELPCYHETQSHYMEQYYSAKLNNLYNRRHSADTACVLTASMNGRINLINYSNKEEKKSGSSNDSSNDLNHSVLSSQTRRNGRYSSLATTHNVDHVRCSCCAETNNYLNHPNESDIIIRRHSFNPSDLNRKICLSQLANRTLGKFVNFSRNHLNHFKINFPSKITTNKNKTIGYASSDSNLHNVSSSSRSDSTNFKQYNKVIIKNILHKSNSNKTKKELISNPCTSCRTNSIKNDFFIDKINQISNSTFLNDFVDVILSESMNEIKTIENIALNYASNFSDSLFKDAFQDVVRLNMTYKKNQHYFFNCNCVPENQKDLSCLLTIYCMMIAIGELNLKNQITIICSHFDPPL